MAISDLLGPDRLAQFEQEASINHTLARLQGLFPGGIDRREVLVLRSFAKEPPLSYWDEATVREVLDCLEKDISRTFAAIDYRSDSLHRGLENLHRESPTKSLQDAYDHGHARELLILANSFLPEYLRLAEHVLGNLTPIIWSVCKKGGVDGKFILKNAINFFESFGPHALVVGYDDHVRNAIAHGQVRFTGFDIEFGPEHPKKLSSLDFLRLFDDLTRTCVGLGLAIQLFWLKNRHRVNQLQNLPLSLITLAAAGAVKRDGLMFMGGIESTSSLAGRQLHVALATDTKSRNQIFFESGKVARELLERGASGFDRFLFEVDSGRGIPSLVIILPKVLAELLDTNASVVRLPEIFADSQLLWYSEPRFVTLFRVWAKIIKAALRNVSRDIVAEWHRRGVFRAKGCYVVRDVRNLSARGIARVEVRARLVHPDCAEDRDLVNAIVKDLVRLGRRRLVKSRSEDLDKGVPWPKCPSHVFVQLFRRDGPLRWLQRDGWMGGNVIAVGEKVWGGHEYVHVKKPQAELGKIRVRYEIDREEAIAAFVRVNEVVTEIRRQHGLQ